MAPTASKNGWQMKLEKPRPGDLPLSATEAVVVFDGRRARRRYQGGVPDLHRQYVDAVPELPRQDIAILSSPSFWQPVGGRRVTFEWVIDH